MGDIKDDVNRRIASKKVFVVSKTTCGYSARAKDCFKKYFGKELSKNDYEAWEIGEERNCPAIQTYLGKLTGARTVPRVFINGKCIGGCTELVALDNSGKLRQMLQELNMRDRGQTRKQ